MKDVQDRIKHGDINNRDDLLTALCDAATESIDSDLGTRHRQQEEAIHIVYATVAAAQLFHTRYLVELVEDDT